MDAQADPPAAPRARAPLDALTAPLAALARGDISRQARARITAVIALIGVMLAAATAWVLGEGADALSPSGWPRQNLQRAILLADLVYLLALAGLVVLRVAALVSARRAQSAGSRLHLRLATVFAVMALAPTILVAIFATITVSYGIEGWFSQQVGAVVRNSLVTAESYEQEHRRRITSEIQAMASVLNREGARGIPDGLLGEVLRQEASDRGFPLAYIFDSNLELIARGEFSYLFSFTPPTRDALQAARDGRIVVVSDLDDSEIRALVYLPEFFDYYLLVARRVDGNVLSLLDETRDTVQLYERLETSRDSILIEFAALYVGFALVVTLAATWAGLWFAERLSRPVGRLAGAAQRVGAGDLDVRVKEPRGDDEIAVLSRVFNRMTEQVKGQRDALVAMNQETEARRRFTETVLAGVTAGVARLDPEGRVDLLNEAGADLLGLAPAEALGKPLAEAAPIFSDLFEEARRRRSGLATDRIHGAHGEQEHDFLARIARTPGEAGSDGYVLTFDDMT
ncbi:MAG: HAMP domain-containing protein, partial [Pseudomonadota bacterium]